MISRGDIYLVDLEPVRGAEANKTRPAVVVSGPGANASADRRGYGVVTVAPMTSNTARILPFHVLLSVEGTGLRRDSKIQAEQVRSLDVGRLGRRVGTVSPHVMMAVDDALRLHLSL